MSFSTALAVSVFPKSRGGRFDINGYEKIRVSKRKFNQLSLSELFVCVCHQHHQVSPHPCISLTVIVISRSNVIYAPLTHQLKAFSPNGKWSYREFANTHTRPPFVLKIMCHVSPGASLTTLAWMYWLPKKNEAWWSALWKASEEGGELVACLAIAWGGIRNESKSCRVPGFSILGKLEQTRSKTFLVLSGLR